MNLEQMKGNISKKEEDQRSKSKSKMKQLRKELELVE
jgi:hypothetical protein